MDPAAAQLQHWFSYIQNLMSASMFGQTPTMDKGTEDPLVFICTCGDKQGEIDETFTV